jgi:putative endonuclease
MPQREYHFYVYFLASRSRTLYIGLTNDIRLRIKQHRDKRPGTHTAKYDIGRLVYYEHFTYVLNAIAPRKRTERLEQVKENSSNRTRESNLGRFWRQNGNPSSFRAILFIIPQRSGGICFCCCSRNLDAIFTRVLDTK